MYYSFDRTNLESVDIVVVIDTSDCPTDHRLYMPRKFNQKMRENLILANIDKHIRIL